MNRTKRVEALKKFVGKRKSFEGVIEKYKKLPKIERLNPARLEEMRIEAEYLSDEEFDSVMNDHEHITTQIEDSSFYRMLSKHWNTRNIDKRLVDSMHSAAATAINGLSGVELKRMVDVERIIKSLGIEAGSMVLAYRLKEELEPEKMRELIRSVEKSNIENVLPTEHKAIDEVKKLQKQEQQIRRQKKSKELRYQRQ